MRRSKSTGRGIVVISTLLISTVLLILVVTLLLSLSNENHLVLRNAYATETLFLGEAGIADATYQLSVDNEWKPDELNPLVVDFPDGNGKYTIFFDSDDLVESSNESVNNLKGKHYVDGPRGPGTVPPYTADVVVTAEVKGRQLRYEALISRGFSEPVSVPLLTSGKIKMKGDVVVRGIESLLNPIAVDAGIHSNYSASQAGIIEWEGSGGEEAFISGEVSTTSNHPQAIQASTGFNPGGVEEGKAALQFPYVDIDAAIASGKNSTVMVPTVGGTTSLSGGNYKYDGGVINGDLVLDGVNLFVNGDLEVNGTIKGTGAIYVAGDTSFRGSAELVTDKGFGMGLFSKGNVKLEGFDGSQFLDSIATANPLDFGKWNEDAKTAHEDLLAIIADPDNYNDGTDPGLWGNSPDGEVDQLRAVLGGGDTETVPTGMPDAELDSLGKMADYLEANFAGDESAEFLVDRLRGTRNLYADGGALDEANDTLAPLKAEKTSLRVGNQNFDKLGTSYFQGLIYTTGAIYASNEVEVVGALLAQRNSQSPQGQWNVGGEDLRAGDVFLTGGSSLVYNKELVEDPLANVPTGPVVVCSWLGR
ncbi:MAG: hypothetical protein KC800_22015 [Candidatus Eremiobacteraeota bacterium]|nr:hypothetical protein [Candidatus Eremiobacteraeota bacterium]